MKRTIPSILTAAFGLLALWALFSPSAPKGLAAFLLDTSILLAVFMTLTALALLFIRRAREISSGGIRMVQALVFCLAFLVTLVAGLLFGVDSSGYSRWISAFLRPLGTALFALLSFILLSAAAQLFQRKGMSVLTVSFGLSALFFVLLGMNLNSLLHNPVLDKALTKLAQLPLIGTRGLLIGMAIGLLLLAIRILLGMERPYDER